MSEEDDMATPTRKSDSAGADFDAAVRRVDELARQSDSNVLKRELDDVKADARALLGALERQTMRSDLTGKCLYSMNVEDAMRTLRSRVKAPERPRVAHDQDITRPAK
jgi:hypothetical protein